MAAVGRRPLRQSAHAKENDSSHRAVAAAAALSSQAGRKVRPQSDAKLPEPRSARAKRTKAFLADTEILQSRLFCCLSALFLRFATWFYGVSVCNAENIPRNAGALIISLHSTHNLDIPIGVFALARTLGTGRREAGDPLPVPKLAGAPPAAKS